MLEPPRAPEVHRIMLALLLLSCSDPTPVADLQALRDGGSAWVDGLPHVQQEPDFCGEACLAMAMAGRGMAVDQGAIFGLTGLDPALGRGAYARDLKVAAEALGFDVGQVWTEVKDGDRSAAEAQLEALVEDLRQGFPSVVCMHFDERPDTTEHFRLVTGYDAKSDELRYHDPALANGADLRMSRARFLALWPLRKDDDTLSFIRLRLKPGDLHAPAPTSGVSPADLAQAVRAARERLAGAPGFSVSVSAPWVVVGDLGAEQVQWYADHTVAWTTRQLRASYFARDPAEPWTIWLFDTDESYTDHTVALFGEYPSTPYGFASADTRALVMNIGTGGGTLVHEMVHPYMYANLTDPPPWMNEGLASLYEHVGDNHGQIWGYPNWRLPGLQRAIKRGDLPSLRWLTSADAPTFYAEESSGLHYAMSRYLMLYLQEQGQLRAFIARYTRDQATDPTGYETLLGVLNVDDVPAFVERWRRWVMRLRWSESG